MYLSGYLHVIKIFSGLSLYRKFASPNARVFFPLVSH